MASVANVAVGVVRAATGVVVVVVVIVVVVVVVAVGLCEWRWCGAGVVFAVINREKGST